MVNEDKVREAVKLYLEAIGEDPNREGLKDTPDRIARMSHELFGGMEQSPEPYLTKVFACDDSEIVMEKGITFYSVCEHHLLPFYGTVTIAYVPDGKVVGLSKLARTVEVYARRAQIQEVMTAQIADAVMEYLQPKGVMVYIEAEHMCMTMRGVQKPGTKTSTVAKRGVFEKDTALQTQFSWML